MFSRLYQLYNLLKNGQEETAKEYIKVLPKNDMKKLRLSHPKLVNLMCSLASFKTDKMYDASPIPEYKQPIKTYTTLEVKPFFDHAAKVIDDIATNWNAAQIIDGRNDIFWLTLDKDANGELHGLEDSLQWTSYFALALINLYDKFSHDPDTEDKIHDLLFRSLKGIQECFISYDTERCIKRHPIKAVKYDLEPISVDMISGLVPLVSLSAPMDLPSVIIQELTKVKTLMSLAFEENDFIIPGYRPSIHSHDLQPNVLWNYGKAMSYIGIKSEDCSTADLSMLGALLKIKPFNSSEAKDRGGLWGTITAMNLANALIPFIESLNTNLVDFMDENYKIYNYSGNAEFSSLLCQAYQSIAYKSEMEDFAYLTLDTLAPFLDMEFPVNGAQAKIPAYTPSDNVPVPVSSRPRTDYMWQRNGYTAIQPGTTFPPSDRNSWQHPSLDFLVPFARVSDVVYYPFETLKQ